VTVNISSPNTKNLRALQSDEALDACWAPLPNAAKPWPPPRPARALFVKIAPDLDEAQVAVIAATLQRHGMDGVIATNTTISRDAVKGMPHAEEAGGLSGAPVLEASNRVIRQLRAALGRLPHHRRGRHPERADAVARSGRRRCGADLQRPDLCGPALVPVQARPVALRALGTQASCNAHRHTLPRAPARLPGPGAGQKAHGTMPWAFAWESPPAVCCGHRNGRTARESAPQLGQQRQHRHAHAHDLARPHQQGRPTRAADASGAGGQTSAPGRSAASGDTADAWARSAATCW
jgi:hypothetical protein